MDEFTRVLAEHPFLEGMKPHLVETIAFCAGHARYEPGQIIYREGDEADQFFLILEGKVSIEIFSVRRGSLTIQTVGPGEVLGWSWLFAPFQRRFDARAIEVTRAVALHGRCLREKADADRELGYELLKRLSEVVVERLKAMTLQVVDMYGKHF